MPLCHCFQEELNLSYELPHFSAFAQGRRLLPELTELQIAEQRLERLLETRPEADSEIRDLNAQIAVMRGEQPEEVS